MTEARGLALTLRPISNPAAEPARTKSRRNPSTKITGSPDRGVGTDDDFMVTDLLVSRENVRCMNCSDARGKPLGARPGRSGRLGRCARSRLASQVRRNRSPRAWPKTHPE